MRTLLGLALATHIPAEVWAESGERSVVTAIELLKEQNRQTGSKSGRQTSG